MGVVLGVLSISSAECRSLLDGYASSVRLHQETFSHIGVGSAAFLVEVAIFTCWPVEPVPRDPRTGENMSYLSGSDRSSFLPAFLIWTLPIVTIVSKQEF